MKIGIYDPYLDTLGGGEKYVLSIAKFFEEKNEVTVFWDKNLKDEINKKFNLELKKTIFKKNIFLNSSFINKLLITSKYDVFFFISDGSTPFLFAKKNFLIFQFPPGKKQSGFLDKIKFLKVNGIICYSNFVKKYLDDVFKLNVTVLYPPADAISGTLPKENIILSVGRFTNGINNKKQDFLIDAFKKLKYNKTWKLIIAGSYLPQDKEFVELIKNKSKGQNIEIVTSPSNEELKKLYLKSKIYWHATGVNEDLNKHPERAEHFGISTVEAMSAGLVPVVVNAGGQKEIVEDEISGYLWITESELLEKTTKLIENESALIIISKNAIKRSRIFSIEKFNENLNKLI